MSRGLRRTRPHMFATVAVVTLVLGALLTSLAADIPSDVRAVANTWAFLAAMGQRCETRLEVYVYAGLSDEVCHDFEDQYARVSGELPSNKAAFEDAARAIAASRSIAAQVEWDLFMHGFETSTAQVFKAMQHVFFLQKYEIDKRKRQERGKRK
jgi:hypothetical protein